MASAVLSVSEVESSQQPAEEAGPLGAEETNEEVGHSGDKDDAGGDVVQVVESLLIGHHIQVPAGYNIQTHTHTHMRAHSDTTNNFPHYHQTHTHAYGCCLQSHNRPFHAFIQFSHTPLQPPCCLIYTLTGKQN